MPGKRKKPSQSQLQEAAAAVAAITGEGGDDQPHQQQQPEEGEGQEQHEAQQNQQQQQEEHADPAVAPNDAELPQQNNDTDNNAENQQQETAVAAVEGEDQQQEQQKTPENEAAEEADDDDQEQQQPDQAVSSPGVDEKLHPGGEITQTSSVFNPTTSFEVTKPQSSISSNANQGSDKKQQQAPPISPTLSASASSSHHLQQQHSSLQQPFGVCIGVAHGTPAFSSGNRSSSSAPSSELMDEAVTPCGLSTGRQWDCVEYARRWLLMAKDVLLPAVAKPTDVFAGGIAHCTQAQNRAALVPTQTFGNAMATTEPPQAGDLIVWGPGPEYPLGHVAVALSVEDGGTSLLIAEQGVDCWSNPNYSRTLQLVTDDVSGSVEIKSSSSSSSSTASPILGWMRVQAPFLGPAGFETADRYRHTVGKGRLQRIPFEPDPKMPWLDRSVPWDNFQVQSFNDGKPDPDDLPSGYYIADYDLWQRSRRLAETLHSLFTDTTRDIILEHAIVNPSSATSAAAGGCSSNPPSPSKFGSCFNNSDNVLERFFGIPRALHPVLRESLRVPCLTGRFDIGFDGVSKLKVFEYNCDSSAALLETVETQNKIAEHYKFATPEQQSAGAAMPQKLVAYWREFARSPVRPPGNIVHFMVDDDPEERYTALCMMQAAKAAKFVCKMVVRLETIKRRAEDGVIVDVENKPVQCVWKTWSWDTALRDYAVNQSKRRKEAQAAAAAQHQQEGGSAAANQSQQQQSHHPKLCLSDVLFDPKIVVLEPFWKAVCGSKALLAYVSEREPNNEFLLPAFFEKNDRIAKAYVKKPVSGRTGANITIHDEQKHRSGTEKNTSKQQQQKEQEEKDKQEKQQKANDDSADSGDEETGGKWSDCPFIYQEKLDLVSYHGFYPILCAWIIGAQFGGMVVRECKNRITQLASPVAPLRIQRY